MTLKPASLERFHAIAERAPGARACGRVTQVVGLVVESDGPSSRVGFLAVSRFLARSSDSGEIGLCSCPWAIWRAFVRDVS
jgi:hypothetical protein